MPVKTRSEARGVPPMETPTIAYITTTDAPSGHFAVMMWWNPDMGGFWEPWDTADARRGEPEVAAADAKAWAKEAGVPYVPRDGFVPPDLMQKIQDAKGKQR